MRLGRLVGLGVVAVSTWMACSGGSSSSSSGGSSSSSSSSGGASSSGGGSGGYNVAGTFEAWTRGAGFTLEAQACGNADGGASMCVTLGTADISATGQFSLNLSTPSPAVQQEAKPEIANCTGAITLTPSTALGVEVGFKIMQGTTLVTGVSWQNRDPNAGLATGDKLGILFYVDQPATLMGSLMCGGGTTTVGFDNVAYVAGFNPGYMDYTNVNITSLPPSITASIRGGSSAELKWWTRN